MLDRINEKEVNKRLQEELKKRDVKSYMDYLSLGSRTTKNYLMISELIDNSISSFDRAFGEDKWKEQLLIEIDLFWASDKKDRLKNDPKNREYYVENFISIKDNAMGMSPSQLLDAVKLNKVNTESSSSKNVHGRGLKQSAFYYGMDLVVKTNNNQESSVIAIEASKQIDQSSEIIFEVNKLINPIKRGTEVLISSLNTYQVFTPKKWVDVVNALSVRYSRYLSDVDGIPRMKIKYKNTFRNKNQVTLVKSNKDIKVDPERGFIIPDKISKVSTIDKAWNPTIYPSKAALALAFEKDLSKKENAKSSKMIDLNWDAINLTKTKIIDLLNGESNLFEWELNFKHEEHVLPVKFYRLGLKTKYAQWRGFTVYEGNRALKHGPIVKGEQSTYLEWKRSSTSTGSTDNRFAGVFDITDLSIATTTTDKSEFRMPREFNDKLDNFLFSVWFAFDIFENLSRPSSKMKKVGIEDIKQIENALRTKYSPGSNLNICSDDIKVSPSGIEGSFDIGVNEKWNINLIPVDQNMVNDTNEIINQIEVTKELLSCTVYFNDEAIIWKSADSGKNFHTEVQYPILIQLAVQFINLKVYDVDVKGAINNIRGGFDEELDY